MREISVVEQRYQAVLAVISDGLSISQVAGKVGVSRQTLHAWLARYEAPAMAADASSSAAAIIDVGRPALNRKVTIPGGASPRGVVPRKSAHVLTPSLRILRPQIMVRHPSFVGFRLCR
jgi:transposase-like protein